jgi:hypothetical protein
MFIRPDTRPTSRRRFLDDPGGGFRGTASHSPRRRRSGGSPRPSGRSFRPARARRQPRAPAPGDCPRYAAPLRPPCGGLRPPLCAEGALLGAGGEPRTRLPATVRGTPPHSARRWRAPAPFVRRGRTAGGGRRAPHAPTLPAILRGTPPHSARLAAGSGPLRPAASGGGRRATHPATEPRQSAPRLRASGRTAPRLPPVAERPSPGRRAATPRRAQPRRLPVAGDPAAVPPILRTRSRDPTPLFSSSPQTPHLPAFGGSRPRGWPGVIFPPCGSSLGGRPAKRGRTATFTLQRLRRPCGVAGTAGEFGGRTVAPRSNPNSRATQTSAASGPCLPN